MPQVTVYIREEDLEKWKAIEKKSEFIHNALASKPSPSNSLGTPNEDGIVHGIYAPATGKSKVVCKQHGIDKNLCRMMKHT